jgi:hypothetical protein
MSSSTKEEKMVVSKSSKFHLKKARQNLDHAIGSNTERSIHPTTPANTSNQFIYCKLSTHGHEPS